MNDAIEFAVISDLILIIKSERELTGQVVRPVHMDFKAINTQTQYETNPLGATCFFISSKNCDISS